MFGLNNKTFGYYLTNENFSCPYQILVQTPKVLLDQPNSFS